MYETQTITTNQTTHFLFVLSTQRMKRVSQLDSVQPVLVPVEGQTERGEEAMMTFDLCSDPTTTQLRQIKPSFWKGNSAFTGWMNPRVFLKDVCDEQIPPAGGAVGGK